MDGSSLNKSYIVAGDISKEVKKAVESRDWRGETCLELCDFVENEIRRKGGSPAFPCNVCEDDTAAHYTAEIDDDKTIRENSLLKVDIGVHVDGYIADTAVTLCYNEYLLDMSEATKSALAEALKVVRSGARTSDVGKVVEAYASRRGYVPISNLSGHSLEQYEVHAGTSIPNVWSPSPSTFKEDKVYAIEPFLTSIDGSGIVIEGAALNIFSLVARKRTKEDRLNQLVDIIWTERRTLPFAARWFTQYFNKPALEEMLPKLMKMHIIRGYPVLIESRSKPVAQAEHTVATRANGFVLLT